MANKNKNKKLKGEILNIKNAVDQLTEEEKRLLLESVVETSKEEVELEQLAINIMQGKDERLVYMKFNRPLQWFALPPENMIALARELITTAEKVAMAHEPLIKVPPH